MKLKKLRLENFRSYRELDISFDNNMNVIIGKNDIGKSTILEALEIFFNNDLVKLLQDDLNIYAKNDGISTLKITLSFEIEPFDTIVIDSSNPTNLEEEFLLDKNSFLTLIQEWDCSKPIKATSKKYFLECEYPTVWKDKPLIMLKEKELQKQIEELEEFLNEEEFNRLPKKINALMRKELYRYKLEDEDKEERTTITIDLAKSDESKNLKESIDKNLPLYFLFQSDRANKDSDDDVQNPLKIAIQKALQSDEIKEKLDEVEKLMQKQIKEVGDSTLLKLQEMDPAIASSLNPNYSKEPDWKSVFKFSFTGGDDIPLNKRGSGVRRLVLLNYFRAEADRKINDRYNKSVIYAIEEPETSQHPDYQKMLIESLLELSNYKDHQVIITTHTPNIAKMVEFQNVIAIIRDHNGNIKKYEDSELLFEDIKNTLGVLPSIDVQNISKVKCIVCLEGKLDIEFLLNINEQINEYKTIIQLKNNDEILMIPMGGSAIQYWVNKNLLKNLQINQVHIYDSDIGSEKPNKYSPYFASIHSQGLRNFTFETTKREMENYIHPHIINSIYEGFPIAYDDNWNKLDLGEEVAKYVHNNAPTSEQNWDEIENKDIKKKKVSRVKQRFNEELSKQLTKQHLEELEAFEEIKEWFEKIKEATRG